MWFHRLNSTIFYLLPVVLGKYVLPKMIQYTPLTTDLTKVKDIFVQIIAY